MWTYMYGLQMFPVIPDIILFIDFECHVFNCLFWAMLEANNTTDLPVSAVSPRQGYRREDDHT